MNQIIKVCSITAALTATLIVVPLLSPGCGMKAIKPIDPTPKLEVVGDGVKSVADVLPKRADRIDGGTAAIQKVVQKEAPKLAVEVGKSTTAITVETAGLRSDAVRLTDTLKQLEGATAAVESLKAANAKLDADNAKLEEEKRNSLRKLTAGIIWFSVIGIGVAAALFAAGNAKTAITVGVGSGATLVAAVVVSQYAVWLAVGVGVVALAGIGYLIWKMFVEKKATTELVQTAEAAKQLLDPSSRAKLFGTGAVPGKLDVIQSPTTKALVEAERGKTAAKKAKVRLATDPVPVTIVPQPVAEVLPAVEPAKATRRPRTAAASTSASPTRKRATRHRTA